MEQNSNSSLDIDLKLVREILVRFIKDEVNAAGFRKAVVGLSGGVDSAVVAFLAAEALGKKNVLGVLMPHAFSARESVGDAKSVVRLTGIRSETVDITPIVKGFEKGAGKTNKIRLGNAMARARMIVLYDRSAREKALVLGTSNKTELLLGYGTMHGDLASAINPVGDLYKTQMWKLAVELGVPPTIVSKKPSADLWKGQSDEAELGFSYAVADSLLVSMVDERMSDSDLEARGFSRRLIETIRTRMKRNQFKRRPPVIAKVGQRTINVDFRYARDWGV